MAELYERAAYTAAHEFPLEAIQLARRLICFDGALLGVGSSVSIFVKNFAIEKACGKDVGGQQPGEYFVASTGSDFIAPSFHESVPHPIACTSTHPCHRLAVPKWTGLTREIGMHAMLSYGDLAVGRVSARSIMLYRMDSNTFDHKDAESLRNFWPHLRQAIAFNLGRTLYCSDPQRHSRAMALVNSFGLIEAAEKPMIDLLTLEWNDFDGLYIPAPALRALLQSGSYFGKRIEMTSFHKYGYMACTAKSIPPTGLLTQSELNVAHRFARGMTHKEIAVHLNVSPHTVRNQLAHVYSKLGVHGKAELARLMQNA